MPSLRRIYLDNAATSWPKPESVYRAVDDYQRNVGAAAGRGAYAEATQAGEAVEAARHAIAQLLGAENARQVVFTCNGTDALNLAIHGAVSAVGGDRPVHVVTTVVEHNSVLRPLRALEDAGRIAVARVPCDATGLVDAAAIRAALRPETCLVALTHASNVTGALQPAADVGAIARQHGALFLLDAAQSLGDVPLDVNALNVDLLAAPGHKGLLGPLGTGILYVRPGVEQRLASVRQGGTGSQSESDRQPADLPDKYESGNLNVPGIVGLRAGVAWLAERTVETIRDKAHDLTETLIDGLAAVEGVTIYGPRGNQRRVGLVSMRLEGYDPQELAATLDAAFGVQVRAGLHCAPLIHNALGTLAAGGAVRFSLGPFSTHADVDAAVGAVREIAAARLTI
jgi:cysteine desulfurase / selenocysteine lyase